MLWKVAPGVFPEIHPGQVAVRCGHAVSDGCSKLFLTGAECYRSSLADRYAHEEAGTRNGIALHNGDLFASGTLAIHPANLDQI